MKFTDQVVGNCTTKFFIPQAAPAETNQSGSAKNYTVAARASGCGKTVAESYGVLALTDTEFASFMGGELKS